MLPDWLRKIAERVSFDENWPDNTYPHIAFEARAIVAEENASDDAQVCLLQRVISEVERLRAEAKELLENQSEWSAGLIDEHIARGEELEDEFE